MHPFVLSVASVLSPIVAVPSNNHQFAVIIYWGEWAALFNYIKMIMSFGCQRVKELLPATGTQKSWCQRGPWKSVALQTSLLSSSNWLEQAAGQRSLLWGEITELLSSLLTAGYRAGMDRFLFHTPAKIQGNPKKDLLSYISTMPLAFLPHPHGRNWSLGITRCYLVPFCCRRYRR